MWWLDLVARCSVAHMPHVDCQLPMRSVVGKPTPPLNKHPTAHLPVPLPSPASFRPGPDSLVRAAVACGGRPSPSPRGASPGARPEGARPRGAPGP